MKMSRFLTVIALALVLVLSLSGCDFINGLINPQEPHACESKCEECGKCTDAECTEDACKDKCQGHTPAPQETTPTISVVPPVVEINAGDEIDLMFGVTVTDEGDENPTLIIEDDDGFDAEVMGEYTITYKAVNKYGKTATATRTVVVNKALSAMTLEVQKNRLGETKWEGTLLNFKNSEYVELTGSQTYDVAVSGVFHNNTEGEITLSIPGGYGVAAILTKNGVVIEGRDGANSKLVNAANPDRTASSVTTMEIDGETVTVASAFAKNLVIPAGGYAVVVQNGYCGTTVDNDGRGFMNYNVIWQYGNVVRLLWADSAEVITPYVDQAPVITGHNNKVLANLTDTAFVLNDAVLAGLTVTDDNGTFDPSDDTAVTVTVKDNGGFDVNTAGSYTVTLEATDGTHTTTVTRVVDVVDNLVNVTVGENSYNLLPDRIAVDQDLSVLGSYLFVVYTPAYEGTLNWSNGWGEAFILNQYGQIVRIYDGANGKYYDADNKAGIVDATKCTAGGYLTEAFNSRQDGEYLIVAPNGNGNLTRAFFLSNRTVGAQMTIPGITFPKAPHVCQDVCDKCGKCTTECAEPECAEKCAGHAHECEHVCETCGKCTDAACEETVCAEKCACHECESVCEHCGGCTDATCDQAACTTKCEGHEGHMFVTIGTSKKYEAVEGKWAINETITTATAANKAVWVFTKDYEGEFTTNGYGVAVVLDRYGRIARVYDGANGGYWLPSGKQASAHFTTATYATVAWSELQEGEYLVVFPNGGSDGNKARQIGLDSRFLFNQKMNITGVEYASETMTMSIGSKTYTAELGKWAVNETITTATAASKAIWVFTTEYTGDFSTNGYGAAVIVDKYGKIVRIYDGANVGYWIGGAKDTSVAITSANFATLAWESLQDGEYLIVLPNGGSEGNAARQIGLDCRWLMGQKLNVTGLVYEIPHDCTSKCETCQGCTDAECEEAACATKCACVAVTIGASKKYVAVGGMWAINETITTATAANKAVWVFTKDYEGEFSTNGYGVAVVLNKHGRIVRVYDGANVGYWLPSGKQASAHFNANTYATTAWAELQEGEYLVVFPNGADGNKARQIGLDSRYLFNQVMNITGIEYASETMTMSIGSKTYTAELGKWAVNETITTATAASKAIWVFTTEYTGDFSTNGYGAAVIVDKYGKIVRIYDGANVGYWIGGAKDTSVAITSANFGTLAWESLQDGEYLIVLPNGGSEGNAARQIGLDCRWLMGQKLNVTGLVYEVQE